MEQSVIIYKTKVYRFIGIIILRKKKLVFKIESEGITYNSTLGNLGIIPVSNIEFIRKDFFRTTDVIKIGVIDVSPLILKMNFIKKNV